MNNPFEALCTYCQKRLAVHELKGQKAVCEDGYKDGFELWEVIDAKRALGHKISKPQSHAAMISKLRS